MLNLLVVGALSFSAPPSCARRDVLRFGAGSVAAACFTVLQSPLPAHAEYFGEPPPKLTAAQYKEKLEQAKEYKYAARPVAGNESPAFKEAEARRVAAANRAAAGGKPKEESAAETMARLGLKTYQ